MKCNDARSTLRLSICIILLLFSATLLSCAKKIMGKHYYMLTYPMSESLEKGKYPYSVRVKDLDINPAYNRYQIVYRYSPHELEYYNYRLWTQKPQKMISDLVRRSIAKSGLFTRVSRKLEQIPPDFTLTGEIDAVEELDSNDVWFAHLSISFSLSSFSGDKVLWTHRFDERREVPVKEPRLVVRTLSEILEHEMAKMIKSLDLYFHDLNKDNKTTEGTTISDQGISQTTGSAENISAQPAIAESESADIFQPGVSPWFDDIHYKSDLTSIPAGKGAIFVPALSDPDQEPVVIVYKENETVETSLMGKKIILATGEYSLKFGSGTVEQMLRCKAVVKEHRTTFITPFWSCLEVRVVDEHFIPYRNSYEIMAMPSREEFGTGFGADEERAEKTNVWVIPPGLYKIVKSGGTYRDRTNFATVYLQEGELTEFTLVMERDSGDFLGAGVIEDVEGNEIIKKWTSRALFGGDVLFLNQDDPDQGDVKGWTTTGNVFFDTLTNFKSDKNRISFRLEVEEGISKRPNENARTLNDRLYFHSIYTYFLKEKFGPYLRAGIETPLTNRYYYFENDLPHSVEIQEPDSEKMTSSIETERIKIGSPFSPIQSKQGLGGNLNLFSGEYVDLFIRLGLGARQYFANDYLTNIEESDDAALFYQVDDYNVYGLEASFFAFARTTKYIVWTCEFDSLFPIDEPDEYLINLRNVISLRLVSFASLNYKLDYIRDPNVYENDPVRKEHQFQLRFSYTLF